MDGAGYESLCVFDLRAHEGDSSLLGRLLVRVRQSDSQMLGKLLLGIIGAVEGKAMVLYTTKQQLSKARSNTHTHTHAALGRKDESMRESATGGKQGYDS